MNQQQFLEEIKKPGSEMNNEVHTYFADNPGEDWMDISDTAVLLVNSYLSTLYAEEDADLLLGDGLFDIQTAAIEGAAAAAERAAFARMATLLGVEADDLYYAVIGVFEDAEPAKPTAIGATALLALVAEQHEEDARLAKIEEEHARIPK